MDPATWQRKLGEVGGREFTLNESENDILRPRFKDPGIHSALNCASRSCPPLQPKAFLSVSLSAQLDAACRQTLNRSGWVDVQEGELRLTRIFDWYASDFTVEDGSVIAFINRYRIRKISAAKVHVSFIPYDWRLNESAR